MLNALRDFLIRRSGREFLAQFGRYAVVGLVSFGLEYGLFLVLLELTNLHYLLANVFVYTVSFWFNYLANRIWTFRSTLPLRRQLPLYALLFAFNLVFFNLILMYLLTRTLGVSARLSKLILIGTVVPWNYILYKTVVYRR